MTDALNPWDSAQVTIWLERRLVAAKREQVRADRAGYEARDDYDKAAAEEYACNALKFDDYTQDQTAFAKRIKELIAREDYPAPSIQDDVKFERHVRSYLRKLAKMTKANEGFKKTLHHQ